MNTYELNKHNIPSHMATSFKRILSAYNIVPPVKLLPNPKTGKLHHFTIFDLDELLTVLIQAKKDRNSWKGRGLHDKIRIVKRLITLSKIKGY